MNTPLPKPGLLLLSCATIVILGSSLLIATLIAANLTWLSRGSLVGGFFLIPLLTALALQQFRGAFRYKQGAALFSVFTLTCLGGLLAILTVVIAIEEVSAERALCPSISSLINTLALPIAILIFLITAGWQNFWWARKLRAAVRSTPTPRPTGYSIRELLVATSAIATIVGMTAYLIRTAPPTFAEHVSASATQFGLPVDASDVSYCRLVTDTTAYEFTCSESEFRKWWESDVGSIEARASDALLSEVVGTFEIERYISLAQ